MLHKINLPELTTKIGSVPVCFYFQDVSSNDVEAVKRELQKYPKAADRVDVCKEGDDLIIAIHPKSTIRRVRRITGYLAETDNWNAAKLAELRDRVKHTNLAAIAGVSPRKTGVKLRLNGLVYESVVDGPGLRDVLFVQGCPHYCPGCQNPGSWDFNGGTEVDVADVIASIPSSPLITGVTFSGGEPFCQAEALLEVALDVKARRLSLWIYTGYTWEELLELLDNRATLWLLTLADVVVDGQFIEEERDIGLPFRGSKNQRLIDVQEFIKTGRVVEWNPKTCVATMPNKI